jgi:hypothetical protein
MMVRWELVGLERDQKTYSSLFGNIALTSRLPRIALQDHAAEAAEY